MSAADGDQANDQAHDEVDAIAEDFAERLRRGENPQISDYLARHPAFAATLADLLPTIAGLERVRNQRGAAAGPPKRLGAYKIIREIGRGGMGVVYEAEEAGLERRVAIKVLPPSAGLDDLALKRFQREARLAARLVHPNIIPIHAFGQEGGSPYFAMHLVEGVGLDHLVDELASGARPTAPGDPLLALVRELRDGGARRGGRAVVRTKAYRGAVANVIAQAADALAFAHGEGVLHRDVKPSNLILDLNGRLWVSDFGLAVAASDDRLTTSGNVSGTLAYMAPERFDGTQDARSDIYGLGLSLYEMLALRPAFVAESSTDLFAAVIAGRIPHLNEVDPEAPESLARIVARACARDPGDRYEDAAALARDLRETVAHAGPPTAATVPGRIALDSPSTPTLRDVPRPRPGPAAAGNRPDATVHPALNATVATGIQPATRRRANGWLLAGIAAAALLLLAVASSFLVGQPPAPKPAPIPAPIAAVTPPAPVALTTPAPSASSPAPPVTPTVPDPPVLTITATVAAPLVLSVQLPVPPLPPIPTPTATVAEPAPVAQAPTPTPAATVAVPATPPAPPVAAAPATAAAEASAKPTTPAKKPKPPKKPATPAGDTPTTTWKPGDPPPGAPPGWVPPGAPAGWKPGDPLPPPPNAPPGWQPGDPLPPPAGMQPPPWGGGPPGGQPQPPQNGGARPGFAR